MELPAGYPPVADAFQLYFVAERFSLKDLSERCFNFLVTTMEVSTIAAWLFDPRVEQHPRLQFEFYKYLINNYMEVREDEGFRSKVDAHNRVDVHEDCSYTKQVLQHIATQVLPPDEAGDIQNLIR
jgi:hypothetical protein